MRGRGRLRLQLRGRSPVLVRVPRHPPEREHARGFQGVGQDRKARGGGRRHLGRHRQRRLLGPA
eukprot:12295159-Prorocentrum_lima.AAC.1